MTMPPRPSRGPTPTKIPAAAKRRIDAVLEKHVAGRNVPGMLCMVATKDQVLYAECRGERVFGKPEEGQVSFDNTLQLMSMTKLVTSLSCLQLAERGLVSFDDPAVIKTYLPELCQQPILEDILDDGTEMLRPRTHPITLRQLLTHTSGLAYEFVNPLQLQWSAKHGNRGILAPRATIKNLSTPLMFEPGTSYAYSTATDWAGVLVERASGLSLADYFDKHIFTPVGINVDDLTFYPTDTIKRRLMHMAGRTQGGTGTIRLSTGARNIAKMVSSDLGQLSGGAGLLGTLTEYVKLLQHVLGCQTANDGNIISPASFKLLFSPALPSHDAPGADSIYQNIGAMMQQLGEVHPPFASGEGVTHSLGFMITEEDSPFGRRKGSGFWLGAAQTHYWIDPTTGILGICATQILDMKLRDFYEVYNEYERAVYDAIETPRSAL